jgi:ribosome maturation factor RimP
MSELAPKSYYPTFDRGRLDAVVTPIVRAHGGEVVDVELKNDQGGWVLRIFVEKLGSSETNASTQDAAVDLDLCTQVARELSPALDAVDVIPHRYHLEVSSPGLERPLRSERDFVRFQGKKAKIKLHTAVKGQKVLVGEIGPLSEGVFTLRDAGGGQQEVPIALENVAQGRLVFEFGPQPKPGKPGHGKHKKKKK